jgi:PAS domain S-box-containing protein
LTIYAGKCLITSKMIPNKEILAGLIEESPYPIYLILGDELRVAVANAATLKTWGKDKSVIGKRFSEALPELQDQPFEGLLRQVISTGEPYHAVNDKATFIIDGKITVCYFTFSYQPLKDPDGTNVGVVCYATDVTKLVESAEKIERLSEQALQTNDELAAINSELEASNEELAATNEELTESYHLLELSERRFRNLIQQAPFSICVIRATDLMVTDVNEGFLELVGKTREQLAQHSIWQGVPEVAEAYAPVMQDVISSRMRFSAREAEVFLVRNGISEQVFVDFTYEPVIDLQGSVSAIMVVGIDVSEKVNTRRAIEEIEERIRLATDAADIGTYEYRFDTDMFLTSDRFDEMVGLPKGFTRQELVSHYHPEDADLSNQALEQAKRTGKVFYETRLLRPGQPMKWLRFQAKVYFDAEGNSIRSLGTVVDVTQYKALQQQKDDFISIASHELKTPITSLKASLQMLTRMKEKPNATLFPKLLDQAARSMDKISELIDDLLNVSKMNQGQVGLKKEWFKVSELLEKSSDHVGSILRHELVMEGELELMVFADEHRMEQVIVNLVNNAIKYAPESYRIFMKVEKLGEFARISVKDTGPGIQADKIPHLFDRYYRADASGKQVSGLGLGLYISADIVQRHGGQIGVDSELGTGSTFWFTLPLNN